MNYLINTNELNFNCAINYDGRQYYNNPMSINIEGKLYILPFGTADKLTVQIDGARFFVIGENSGLGYIGMTIISTDTQDVCSCFLQGNDLTEPENMSYGIFEKETDEQIKILWQYIN